MNKPIIRYTGSPDSSPEQWLRINHLTHQPGPGSAYRVTIEPLEVAARPPLESQVMPRDGLKTEWKIHQWGNRESDMPVFHNQIIKALKGRSRVYDVVCGSGWARFPSSDLQDEFESLLFRML